MSNSRLRAARPPKQPTCGRGPGSRLRHALDAVYARLVFQRAVHVVARHLHHHLLVAAGGAFRCAVDLVAPALALHILGVHAQQVAGEEGCLVAARAAADLDDGVLFVLRILGDEQQFDLLLHAGNGRFEFGHLLAGHFAQVVVLLVGQNILGLPQVVDGRAVAVARFHDRFQLLVFLVELDEFLDVGDHFGVGDLLADLLEFDFQTVESVEYAVVCHKCCSVAEAEKVLCGATALQRVGIFPEAP